jgi:hypothetical protein
VEFIVHQGDNKDCSGAVHLSDGAGVAYLVAGRNEVFAAEPDLNSFPQGDLSKACAAFVSGDVILWNVPTHDSEGQPTKVLTVHVCALSVP